MPPGICEEDYRRTFRLAGDCRRIGADAFIWRRHLLEGMRSLLGDFAGIIGAGCLALPARVVQLSLVVEHGWECEASRRRWIESLARMVAPQAETPQSEGCLREFAPPLETKIRPQTAGDGEDGRSDGFQGYLSSLHIDDSLGSFHETPEGRFHAVVLHHSGANGPWTARELELLHQLHREIIPMIGRDLADFDSHETVLLAPRLEQALDAMLEGMSEKEIAVHLGLSIHTVHQYAKTLYRRYRVRSRSELLALWIGRRRLAMDGVHAALSARPGSGHGSGRTGP